MTYPTSIDALVNDKATITLIRAIMTELGTTPSGSEATVAARLDAVDIALADGSGSAPRVVTVADLGASYTLDVDDDPYVVLLGTATTNVTLQPFSNMPAGYSEYVLAITASGANRTVTLPGGSSFTIASGTTATVVGYSPNGSTIRLSRMGVPFVSPEDVDAKGDLLVATAADTLARMAVSGTDGRVLTEDSTKTHGMSFQALPTSFSPRLPGYMSADIPDGPGGTLAVTANRIYGGWVAVPRSGALSKAYINCTASAAGNMIFALYTINTTTGDLALLWDSGSVALSGTGNRGVPTPTSPPSLTQGTRLVQTVQFSGTPTIARGAVAGTSTILTLPAGFLDSDTVGAKLKWHFDTTFGAPSSIVYSDQSVDTTIPINMMSVD